MSKRDRKKRAAEYLRATQTRYDETTRLLEQRIQELAAEIERRRASS
jgi:phosphoglycerate-specific signal transduction histidine kinase